MRFSTKVAGLVLAAAAVGVPAGMAAAASASTAAPQTLSFHQSVRGDTKLSLVYQGTTYNYQLRYVAEYPVAPGQQLIEGQLGDPYEPGASVTHPAWLPITGVQVGNEAVITVQYPTSGPIAGPQGDRTFTFVLTGHHGAGSGVWDESGLENGNGAATIGR